MTRIPFREWFDINNETHRKAYLYFRKNGVRPVDFLPDEVDMFTGGIWTLIASEAYLGWLERQANTNNRAMRVLESLTPLGSEYHNDPERCGAYIRDRIDSQGKMIVKLAKKLNARTIRN